MREREGDEELVFVAGFAAAFVVRGCTLLPTMVFIEAGSNELLGERCSDLVGQVEFISQRVCVCARFICKQICGAVVGGTTSFSLGETATTV